MLTVMRVIQDIGPNDPIFEGGDCEDWAQTYMQIIHNIYKKLPQLLESVKTFFDQENAVVFLNNIFGRFSQPSLQVYMARGIYFDDVKNDQNHTFSVVYHLKRKSCSFSIVENVIPTFIIQETENCDTVRQKFIQNNFRDTVSYLP